MRRGLPVDAATHQQIGRVSTDVATTAACLFDGRDEFLELAALGEIPDGAGTQRSTRKLDGGVHAEDKRGETRANPSDFFDEFQPTHARQRDVGDHQVPIAVANLPERARRVRCFTNHSVLHAIGEHGANALTVDRVIVNEENPYHRTALTFRSKALRAEAGDCATGTSTDTTVPFPRFPEI